MRSIAFTGLMKLELPAYGALPAYDVLLCDGGFKVWASDGTPETYRDRDPVFGAIGAVDSVSEGVGEEVPVFSMTLLPPGDTPPSRLSAPGYQQARTRFWIAEYDVATNAIIGTPDLQFEGQLDQTTLTFGRGQRLVEMTVGSAIMRLLERNIGNSLNPSWHKSIHPGETGHDNATGLGRGVAWGVEAPPGAAASFGGSFGGGAGGRNFAGLDFL